MKNKTQQPATAAPSGLLPSFRPTSWMETLLPFAGLAVVFTTLSILSPHFLTLQNLANVARQTAVINIMALGMTIIIISGGIDLSVGSVMAFSGIVGTTLIQAGWPLPLGIAGGMAAGMAWGLINSLLITQLRVSPFIATLGTLGAARGVTLVMTDGLPVVRLPREFGFLSEGSVLGIIPMPLAVLVTLALMTGYLLKYTRLGRYAYAIGSNREAARYAGIPITRYLIAFYMLSGALTGLAGMIESSRLMTGQPTAGTGYELSVIAAVVIGGGSLSGGEGSVLGTVIGAFIMSLISNGSNLLGVSPYWQPVLIGSVIVLAVAMDALRKRRSA